MQVSIYVQGALVCSSEANQVSAMKYLFFTIFFTIPFSFLGFAFGRCNEQEWFQCKDSLCITKEWKCDGQPDCVDGSDETDCENGGLRTTTWNTNELEHCDEQEEFRCKTSKQCIPNYWLCDGVRDCTDGSDETDCENGELWTTIRPTEMTTTKHMLTSTNANKPLK